MEVKIRGHRIKAEDIKAVIRGDYAPDPGFGEPGFGAVLALKTVELLDHAGEPTPHLYEYALGLGLMGAQGEFVKRDGRLAFVVTEIEAGGGLRRGALFVKAEAALADLIARGRASVEGIGLGKTYQIVA